MLKNIVEKYKLKCNEGLVDKIQKWFIKNVTSSQKKYIETQSKNGRSNYKVAKSFIKIGNAKVPGYVWVVITSSRGEEELCLLDDKTPKVTAFTTSEIEDSIIEGAKVLYQTCPLEDLEKDDIIPEVIVSLTVDGE